MLTPSLLRARRAARSVPRGLLRLGPWLLVALLAVLVLLPAGVNLSGRQVLVVLSGSMEPTFSAGDAVLVSPVDSDALRPGQVVSYRASGSDRLTTHRVVSLRTIQGDLYVQTRGDANAAPDPDFTPVGNVVGVMGARVPHAGFVLNLVSDPHLRLVAFGFPLLVALLGALRDLFRSPAGTSRQGRRLGWRVVLGLVSVSAALTAAFVSTGAVFVDSAVVDGNTFSTAETF